MSEAVMEEEQTAEGFVDPSTDGLDQAAEREVDEFQQRVMTDGEFALEQLRKRDATVSTFSNRLKALESIENLVKYAGGSEELTELANLGSRVQQHPDLMEVIQRTLTTGRMELPQAAAPNGADDEDEWMDEDVKKVNNRLMEKINALEERLGGLSQMAGAADVRSKEQRVQKNIEDTLREFEGDEEAFAEASQTIMSQYKRALAAAENGDASQAKLIDDLAGPNGKGILESATIGVYKKHARKLLAAQNTQTADVSKVLGKSTDERHTNPSRPGTPQLPPLPKGRVSANHVLEVMQAAARRKGIDLSKLQ